MPYGLCSRLTQVAVQHGLQLTVEALVAACKARVDFSVWLTRHQLPQFFPGCSYGDTVWQLPDNFALPEVVVAVCYGNMEVLKRLLPQVTREQMPDVLQIAVNRCLHKVATLEAVLEHDRLHTQLLHAASSCNSAGGTGVNHNPTTLVQQLLIDIIVPGEKPDAAISMLIATPAAQALDAATVLKLLYLEVQYSGAAYFDPCERIEGSALAALCSLPAVHQLSAAQVGNLMHYALMTCHCGRFGALLGLKQAQQLPPKQLFKMLLFAASHAADERGSYVRRIRYPLTNGQTVLVTQHRALLCDLAALGSAKQLAPGDAFKLLEAALRAPWVEMGMNEVLQQDLDAMDLGSQLTGSELLQLMTMSAKDGSGDCCDLSALMPAATLIDDEAGYVAFVQTAIDGRCTPDVINITASQINLTMRLGPDSVVRLLQKCVSSGFGVCDFILQIPAVAQIPTDAAGELLLQAARKGLVHEMQELLQISAVAELSAALLAELLQVILAQGNKPEFGCNSTDILVVPKLLKLHAARQLTAEAVTQSLLQVIGWRVKLRQALQDDAFLTQSEHQQLAATADVMQELLQLTDAVALPESTLVQLLQAAIAADDSMSLGWLCRLTAIKQLGDAAALRVYVSALEAGNRDMLQQLQEWVPQMAVEAGTAQITAAQLQKQIASALALQQLQAAIDLCQHPAASQISPIDMQLLLKTALQLPRYSTARTDTSSMRPLDVASVMVSMQAAQAVTPSAVTELMLYCLKQQCEEGVRLISKLPATAQLNQQQCESLLQQAVDAVIDNSNSVRSRKTLQELVQLRVIRTLPAQAVMPLLLSSLKHGVQLPTLELLVHQVAAAQTLSADDVRVLLFAAVEAQDACTFSWLKSFPAAPDDEEVQAWAVVVGLVSA